MRIIVAILISLGTFCALCSAQGPDLIWSRTYSNPTGTQGLFSVDTASGGGLIVAGYVTNPGGYDFLAMRLNSAGDTLWTRMLDAGTDDVAYVCRSTSDGGFILAGRSNTSGSLDIFLAKLSSAGAVLWTKTYAWTSVQWIHDIIELPGVGYTATGYHLGSVLVFHVNTLGDSVWAQTPIAASGGETIRAIPGGHYIIAASIWAQMGLVEVDGNGNLVTSYTYQSSGAVTYGSGAVPAQGGGYYLAGYTYPCGGCHADAYVLKITNAGGVVWSLTYGLPAEEDFIRAIVPTFDGGVAAVGYHWQGAGYSQIFAMKISAVGTPEWCRVSPDSVGHDANAVIQLPDSGLVFAGYAGSSAVVGHTQSNGASGGCSSLQGGEDCATAINSLPFHAVGMTTGKNDDIGPSCLWGFGGAPDVCYSYRPLLNEEITISLCNSNYDTELYVFENGVMFPAYACDSDACHDPAGNPYRSKIECLPLTAGNVYCIVIDGYWDSAGDYDIEITRCQPCVLPCPPVAIPEGEPLCFQGYVDTYNSGCDLSFPGLIFINCGDVICGETGNYLNAAGTVWQKDKDWYFFGTGGDCELIWNVESETPVRISITDGFCSPASAPPIYPFVWGFTTGGRCSPAEVRVLVPIGIYWFSVEPLYDQGTPCGTRYVATLTCNCPAPPVTPANDNCGNCTAVTIAPGGVPVTFAGNNQYASRDCIYNEFPETWYCITTTAMMDLAVGQCGTTPLWRSATEWMWHSCVCTPSRTLMDFKIRSCADNNYETYFYDLPPATYYFPVRSEDHMRGPYQLTIEGNIFAPPTCNVIGQCPANLTYGHPNNLYWDGEWDPVANRVCWSSHFTGGGVGTVQNILRWNPTTCILDPPVVWSSVPSIGPCKLLAFDPRNGGQYWTGTIAWGANPAKLYLVNNAGTVVNSWTAIPGLPSMEWTGGAFDRDHNHLWVIVNEGDPLAPTSNAYELDVSNAASPLLIQGPHTITSPVPTRPILDASGADYVDGDDLLIVIGNGQALNDYLICYTDVQPNYVGPPPGPGLTVYDWCVPQTIGNDANGVAVVDAPAGSPHRVYLTPYYNTGTHPVYVYEACASASLFQVVISTSHGGALISWRPIIGPSPLTEAIYRVYRDANPDFEPSDANLIASVPDTSYLDEGVLDLPDMKFYYAVTAETIGEE
jgi:hypothetical protein